MQLDFINLQYFTSSREILFNFSAPILTRSIYSPILAEREHVLQRWIAALYMELDVLREYKSPCTFKLIKYFAVLASFTAAQTWISQSLMDISIQAIIRASQSDIILDNGSMINLIKDMRKYLRSGIRLCSSSSKSSRFLDPILFASLVV